MARAPLEFNETQEPKIHHKFQVPTYKFYFFTVYVEASDACNILSFQLAGTGKYAWEIKITQLDCFSNELAPTGCTQYHFGEISGTVQSFNYVGGTHLANQNQLICIRRELNMCRICYATAMAKNVFDISGKASTAASSMALIFYCFLVSYKASY